MPRLGNIHQNNLWNAQDILGSSPYIYHDNASGYIAVTIPTPCPTVNPSILKSESFDLFALSLTNPRTALAPILGISTQLGRSPSSSSLVSLVRPFPPTQPTHVFFFSSPPHHSHYCNIRIPNPTKTTTQTGGTG